MCIINWIKWISITLLLIVIFLTKSKNFKLTLNNGYVIGIVSGITTAVFVQALKSNRWFDIILAVVFFGLVILTKKTGVIKIEKKSKANESDKRSFHISLLASLFTILILTVIEFFMIFAKNINPILSKSIVLVAIAGIILFFTKRYEIIPKK